MLYMFNSIADQLASKKINTRNVGTPYLSQSVSPTKFEPIATLLTSIVVSPASASNKPKMNLPVRYENQINNGRETNSQTVAQQMLFKSTPTSFFATPQNTYTRPSGRISQRKHRIFDSASQGSRLRSHQRSRASPDIIQNQDAADQKLKSHISTRSYRFFNQTADGKSSQVAHPPPIIPQNLQKNLVDLIAPQNIISSQNSMPQHFGQAIKADLLRRQEPYQQPYKDRYQPPIASPLPQRQFPPIAQSIQNAIDIDMRSMPPLPPMANRQIQSRLLREPEKSPRSHNQLPKQQNQKMKRKRKSGQTPQQPQTVEKPQKPNRYFDSKSSFRQPIQKVWFNRQAPKVEPQLKTPVVVVGPSFIEVLGKLDVQAKIIAGLVVILVICLLLYEVVK